MSLSGPILCVEDDEDDQYILRSVVEDLNIPNELIFFQNGKQALDFLTVTIQQPFIIICDINMPVMNGLELKKRIMDNDYLRKKAIPFVFLTTAADEMLVKAAYEYTIQGFFKKESSIERFKFQIESIVHYWQKSLHPNSFK